MNTTQIRTAAVLSVIIVIVGIAFFWVRNNSYISVSVANTTDKQITYNFINQKSNKTTTVASSKSSVKKRLPRGSYNVQVTQDETSFFTVANSPGFLRTTTTQGEVVGERSRTFVGNNPSPCLFYDGVLYSFVCGGSLSQVNRHIPATATSPTYVSQPLKNNYQDVTSSVTTAGGKMYVLVSDESYILASLDSAGKLTEVAKLPDLTVGRPYKISPYKDGFVVFTADFETILYYATPQSKPEKISVDRPKNTVLRGASLTSVGDTLVLMYSSIDQANISDGGANTSKDIKDEIVVFRNGTVVRYTPKTHATSAFLCGTSRLCTIEGTDLVVYRLNEGKLGKQYRITDVQAARAAGKNVYVVRSNQVLVLNPDDSKGYIAYSMGPYKHCGQGQSGDSLLLCVVNSKSQKAALLIDPSKPIGEPIDKQVDDLLKQAEVTDVSAYKNFIYVVPNYGRSVYIPSQQSFGYDPAVVKVVNQKINEKIKALNINTNAYTIGGLSN